MSSHFFGISEENIKYIIQLLAIKVGRQPNTRAALRDICNLNRNASIFIWQDKARGQAQWLSLVTPFLLEKLGTAVQPIHCLSPSSVLVELSYKSPTIISFLIDFF